MRKFGPIVSSPSNTGAHTLTVMVTVVVLVGVKTAGGVNAFALYSNHNCHIFLLSKG